MRATTLQALVYPLLLCLALCGLVGILVFFLIPRLALLFPGGRDDLPAQTRFVLALAEGAVNHAWFSLLGIVIGLASIVVLWRTERGRFAWDRALLLLPVIGPVARAISTSKFAGTAGILQSAGCEVFVVLEVATRASGNRAMQRALQRATQRVRSGQPLSQALEEEPLVDRLLVQLVAVGEKTGSLDRCLESVAAHYDEELPRSVKRMLSLLEPGLLILAGGVVAFLLLSALLPMFEVMESLR
jgi:type II secretory pathway component PulF